MILLAKKLRALSFCLLLLFNHQIECLEKNQISENSTQAVRSESEMTEQTPDLFDISDLPPQKENQFRAKFLNMLFLLGLIIAFMLIASWMIKRLSKQRIDQLNDSSSIKILEQRYLSPKSVIYLIEIDNKKLIIGESPTGLHLLGQTNHDENL